MKWKLYFTEINAANTAIDQHKRLGFIVRLGRERGRLLVEVESRAPDDIQPDYRQHAAEARVKLNLPRTAPPRRSLLGTDGKTTVLPYLV